jgi:tRNA A-37 threonylcarbamoyl transferase component Bud32
VSRHRLGGRTFYLKRYIHDAVPLRPLKFFVKATQARQEWKLAQQLEARRIPIVRHVALGERRTWRGTLESLLVTEGFDGVELSQARDIDPQAVLNFVETMHERGVLQEDLHLGNLLVKRMPFELCLVDLHGTFVREKLTEEERRKNLALLRIFLPIRVGPAVEHQSRELRKVILYERSLRCLRINRDFDRQRHGNLDWQVRRPFVSNAVARVLSAPDDFLAMQATILKAGKTSTVGKDDGLVLKRFNLRKMGNLLKDLFRDSKARRAFQKAFHLELTGIPTARSIATADRRCCGFLVQSYVLMEEIRGAVDLTKYFRNGGKPEIKLIREAARLIAKLHNEGFSHRDLKASNLVIGGQGRLYLIDLDGMTFLRKVPEDRVALDLARLDRGVAKYSVVTTRDRIRFLFIYCRTRGIRRVPRATTSV